MSLVTDSCGCYQGLLASKHRCVMVELAVESSDWIR